MYKRSATGSEEMENIAPISPKVPRVGDQSSGSLGSGSHHQSVSGGLSSPSNLNRPFYPVFNNHSPNGHGAGGSTGTQSQESDSNSTEGNDRVSPPTQLTHANVHAMKPFQPSQLPPSIAAAQRPINYPIPLPGTQSGLASI